MLILVARLEGTGGCPMTYAQYYDVRTVVTFEEALRVGPFRESLFRWMRELHFHFSRFVLGVEAGQQIPSQR